MQSVILNSEMNYESKPIIEVANVFDEKCNSLKSESSLVQSEFKGINCISASHSNEIVAVGSDNNIM